MTLVEDIIISTSVHRARWSLIGVEIVHKWTAHYEMMQTIDDGIMECVHFQAHPGLGAN